MKGIRPYKKYKRCNLTWLEEIPENWEVKKLKYIASCFPSNVDKHVREGEKEVWLCNYTDVYKNDFIDNHLNFMRATASDDQVKKFALLPGDVIITKDSETANDIAVPAFVRDELKNVICGYHLSIIRSNEFMSGRYLHRLFLCKEFNSQFEICSNGVTRVGLGVYDLQNAMAICPSYIEQEAIADFLDYKTEKIDRFIRKKNQLIKLLTEQKAGVINQAVTKGIIAKVKLKSSGVEWLGSIPWHWDLRKLKFVVKIEKVIAGALGFDVLSITQKGIKIKDTKSGAGQLSMDYTKYQLVKKGYFAMNHMDLLTGYVDISKFDGVISPDYRVFKSIDPSCFDEYLLFLFQLGYFRKIFYAFGRGVSQFGRWRLPSDEFNNFKIPIPPIVEQKAIVAYIKHETQKLNNTIQVIEKEITLAQEYRAVLIAEAVTGKIDVRKYRVTKTSTEQIHEYPRDEVAIFEDDSDDWASE